MLSLRCFAAFHLSLGVLCSIHLISTFRLVSPIYFSPQIHIPSYILHAGCNDLSFKWKKSSYFSGKPFYSNIKFIISEAIKFFINCLDAISFFTQKVISIKITGFGISKKFCGIKYSSSFLFSFSINVLTTL